MKIKSIASSSKGNCTWVQDSNGVSILIDVGIPLKRVKESVGTSPIDAIFITHDHSDHWSGLGPVCRYYSKLTNDLKVHIHEYCWSLIKDKTNIKKGLNSTIISLNPKDTYSVGNLKISPFSTVHDAAYSVGYVVEENGKKLGYLTDTGSFTKLMKERLKDCDAYIIEAEYDAVKMANYMEYDDFLKDRITSNFGHLDNKQTFDFLEEVGVSSREFILFAHLSENTNDPEIVMNEAARLFPDYNNFHIAPMDQIFEL